MTANHTLIKRAKEVAWPVIPSAKTDDLSIDVEQIRYIIDACNRSRRLSYRKFPSSVDINITVRLGSNEQ